MSEIKIGGILDPRNVMKVNERPMQLPGRDELLRTATVGGPEKAGDRRIFLSKGMLSNLMEVAQSSPTGRVQVDRAGVRVDLHVDGNGHQYEVWTLIGANPKPEQLPRGFSQFIENSRADR